MNVFSTLSIYRKKKRKHHSVDKEERERASAGDQGFYCLDMYTETKHN
jgi:hypothetical protein